MALTRPFIMAAPNGARRSKADHPALPVSLSEIVAAGVACHAAGADGMHLHIRDAQGAHSLDAGRYLETLAELQHAAPKLAVQITTEAAGVYDVAAQLACLTDVQPAWASISVREINRAPELADQLYGLCAEQSTRVQHILYDADDFELLQRWQDAGTVRPDQSDLMFVLGRYLTGRSSEPADLEPFMRLDRGTAKWMVCAFGTGEHACLTHAARHGGDLRVGFENSLQSADGVLWPDCTASVAALVASIARLNSQPEPTGG